MGAADFLVGKEKGEPPIGRPQPGFYPLGRATGKLLILCGGRRQDLRNTRGPNDVGGAKLLCHREQAANRSIVDRMQVDVRDCDRGMARSVTHLRQRLSTCQS